MGTLFVAGAYGVGKSTLCEKLSKLLGIPHFSAGTIISAANGEQYGANKAVSDKALNQDILAVEVTKQLELNGTILLDGHFCIFDDKNQVETLPQYVFERLHITKVLLLEAPEENILQNLAMRDQRVYAFDEISALGQAERLAAQKISAHIGCVLHIHRMRFDKNDLMDCLSMLKGAHI